MRSRSEHQMRIVVAGKSLTVPEASKATGIPKSVLWRRLQIGWSDEQIINTPTGKPVSKNEIEMEMNEISISMLPKTFADVVKSSGYEGTKFGSFIRNHHREIFDKWFSEEYPNERPK